MKLDRAFYSARDKQVGRILSNLMDFVPMLPLTLTGESKRKLVRVIGLLCFIPWALPAMVLICLPCLLLMVIDIFQEI